MYSFKNLISSVQGLFTNNTQLSFELVESWLVLLPKIINTSSFQGTFLKKNGEIRFIFCRFEGTRHLEKGIITVYDLQERGFRSINLNTLQHIQVGNTHYSLKK